MHQVKCVRCNGPLSSRDMGNAVCWVCLEHMHRQSIRDAQGFPCEHLFEPWHESGSTVTSAGKRLRTTYKRRCELCGEAEFESCEQHQVPESEDISWAKL